MTYEEFVIETLKKEIEKHGGPYKAAKANNIHPSTFSSIIKGKYIPKMSAFSKWFPYFEWPEFDGCDEY